MVGTLGARDGASFAPARFAWSPTSLLGFLLISLGIDGWSLGKAKIPIFPLGTFRRAWICACAPHVADQGEQPRDIEANRSKDFWFANEVVNAPFSEVDANNDGDCDTCDSAGVHMSAEHVQESGT